MTSTRPNHGPEAWRDADLAVAALTLLTVVTAVGMGRLFAGTSYLVPLLTAGLVAHAVALGVRRAALLSAAGVVLPLAAVAVVAAWLVLPDSTTFGIPWKGTLDAALDALRAAGADFGQAVAPVPASKGFLLASMLGVTIVAMCADWAAFRVGSTVEALVPAFGLFLFTSILGAPRYRWPAVAVEIAAMLAFAAAHGAQTRAITTPWFASRAQGARTALLQGAALLGVVAVLGAVLVGPRLPGATNRGIFDWRARQGEGGGRRTTISPLVDIRNRLTDRSNAEVFTVRSSERAYWRLTSLDTFNGVIWSSNGSYRGADGKLPKPGPRPTALAVTQEFSISDLASIWLPAAFRPTRVEGLSDLSYNADSASLISKQATSDGLQYSVQSELPQLTAAGLSTAPPPTAESLRRHLELPQGISPRTYQLAREITGGQVSPYAKARALQDYLRNNYRYSLEADQGHDDRALDRFLFSTRAGYCEQFAGSYGVLARIAGLPSRVAVGFTPGVLGADGAYHVLGLHAHAWPEVYLEGYGWVAFEPTPGRGAPRAEPYTGVPESQASETQPGTATTALPTTTLVPGGGGGTTTTAAPVPQPTETPAPDRRRVSPWLLAGIGALLAVLGGWLLGVPAWRRVRRDRRRAAATTPAARVLVAWVEADEALALTGGRRRPAETLDEHARRAAGALSAPGAAALSGLAGHATRASYAPEFPTELAGEAITAAEEVGRAAAATASRTRRLRRELSLRG